MILDHLAAIVLFSGPLLYIGLWMAVDPAGIVRLPESVVRVSRNLVRNLGGLPAQQIVEPGHAAISRRVRTTLRVAGVVLALFAIVI